MSIFTELALLEAQDVVVWAQEGKLKYQSDCELAPNTRARLIGLKPEVLNAWEQSDVIPLELNGLQQAYWLGEDEAFSEHTPAFLHLVFEGDLPDHAAMQSALIELVKRHPPLGYRLSAEAPVFLSTAEEHPRIEYCDALPETCAASFDSIDKSKPLLLPIASGASLFRLIVVDDGNRRCLHGIFRLAFLTYLE